MKEFKIGQYCKIRTNFIFVVDRYRGLPLDTVYVITSVGYRNVMIKSDKSWMTVDTKYLELLPEVAPLEFELIGI